MAHELPPLPYAFDALEPHIDARTLELHHGKHHATYVNKLNAALAEYGEHQNRTVEELLANLASLPDSLREAVRFHGGGHHSHNVFWKNLSPDGGGAPDNPLADAINRAFGGFDKFKDTFSTAAATLTGSGWTWLCLDGFGKLCVRQYPNHDSPLTDGFTPLLVIDVWEHAYYLNYQNRRPDFITAFWNVVNWRDVAMRFAQAT